MCQQCVDHRRRRRRRRRHRHRRHRHHRHHHHHLHHHLSPAILFISTCKRTFLTSFEISFSSLISFIAFNRSLIITPFLGLPASFIPITLPSITSLNNRFPLNKCPIQFFLCYAIILITHLSSII